VLLIIFVTALSNLLRLNTLSFILNSTFSVLTIGAVIIFQPELRRGLEQIGRSTLKAIFTPETGQSRTTDMINDVAKSCKEMSKALTGALIVIERQTKVGDIIDTGIALDAVVSAELLVNIFEKNTPLHDGAVVIRDDRVVAATCYLPLTADGELNKELGTRHRAAIGMTEVSDAVVVVVSEETGAISIVHDNEIERGLGESALRRKLTDYIKGTDIPVAKGINFFKKKVRKKEYTIDDRR
jgi:diadenylate cyclase